MRIAITFEPEMSQYTVRQGKIFYVQMSKPCAVGDMHSPYGALNLAPYKNTRKISYGVYVEQPDGYSIRPRHIHQQTYINIAPAQRDYINLCNQFQCNLSWSEVRKLMGWN